MEFYYQCSGIFDSVAVMLAQKFTITLRVYLRTHETFTVDQILRYLFAQLS